MTRVDHVTAPGSRNETNVAGILVTGALAMVFGLLLVPIVCVGGRVAWWAAFGGPPLDFDAPHGGQVIAHIDILGRVPPDIAGIRITNASTHAVVWDVKPTSPTSECWNGCWNLTLKVGENPASFLAGHQQFVSERPQSQTFTLSSSVAYVFEVWDSHGRVERQRFTL